MEPIIIVLIILVVLVFIALIKTIQVIPQASAAIVERFGRYTRTLNAGLNIVVPFIDSIRNRIDLREQVVPFPPQPVITQDNLVVNIDTVIYYQVTDARAATYEVASYIQAIEQLTVTTLRNIIGGMDLERTLTSREEINAALRGVLDEATGKWGIRVNRVELKAIEPPTSIQDSMEKQMRADRDKRAAILQAEGIRQSADPHAPRVRSSPRSCAPRVRPRPPPCAPRARPRPSVRSSRPSTPATRTRSSSPTSTSRCSRRSPRATPTSSGSSPARSATPSRASPAPWATSAPRRRRRRRPQAAAGAATPREAAHRLSSRRTRLTRTASTRRRARGPRDQPRRPAGRAHGNGYGLRRALRQPLRQRRRSRPCPSASSIASAGVGSNGCRSSGIPACSGVRSALRWLSSAHDATVFSQVSPPPCDRGTTWSTVVARLPAVRAPVLVPHQHTPPRPRRLSSERHPYVPAEPDHPGHRYVDRGGAHAQSGVGLLDDGLVLQHQNDRTVAASPSTAARSSRSVPACPASRPPPVSPAHAPRRARINSGRARRDGQRNKKCPALITSKTRTGKRSSERQLARAGTSYSAIS